MIINNNNQGSEHVKFISYTGKYPNLCRGVLTLEINGVECKFGHNDSRYDFKSHSFTDEETPNYNKFWTSGGYIDEDYDAHDGEWEIDVESLPEQFRKYATEIDEIFNENVEYGCCGGCI